MLKQIIINDREVDIEIKKSTRARRMQLAIHSNGAVVATRPKNVSLNALESFIKQKAVYK